MQIEPVRKVLPAVCNGHGRSLGYPPQVQNLSVMVQLFERIAAKPEKIISSLREPMRSEIPCSAREHSGIFFRLHSENPRYHLPATGRSSIHNIVDKLKVCNPLTFAHGHAQTG